MCCSTGRFGAEILLRQRAEGWGTKVIDRLGRDLQAHFPGIEGFSAQNLKYMRSLAEACPDPAIVPQRVALLPWGHLRVLLDRVKEPAARDWYLAAAVDQGWSRDVLGHMIAGRLHAKEGKSHTNFQRTCHPSTRTWRSRSSATPTTSTFSPWLNRSRNASSNVDRSHTCAICFSNSAGASPSWAAKSRFRSTIGLLLCETSEGPVVEYAFQDIDKPIGVSTYRVTREMPKMLQQEVPSIEDLEVVVEKLKGEFQAMRKAEEGK